VDLEFGVGRDQVKFRINGISIRRRLASIFSAGLFRDHLCLPTQYFNRLLGMIPKQSVLVGLINITYVYGCRRRSIEGGYFILLVRLKDLDSDVVRVDV